MTEHLERARESAQRTYDRRRARSAADTLATIPPNRWDDHTRQVISTLATVSAPSRINALLDDAFEPPIGGLDDPLLIPPRREALEADDEPDDEIDDRCYCGHPECGAC